jgi:hypothetical protein
MHPLVLSHDGYARAGDHSQHPPICSVSTPGLQESAATVSNPSVQHTGLHPPAPSLSKHIPHFFGSADISDVFDVARSVKASYLLDCCYVLSQIGGSEQKLYTDHPWEWPDHIADFVKQLRCAGIRYTRMLRCLTSRTRIGSVFIAILHVISHFPTGFKNTQASRCRGENAITRST